MGASEPFLTPAFPPPGRNALDPAPKSKRKRRNRKALEQAAVPLDELVGQRFLSISELRAATSR